MPSDQYFSDRPRSRSARRQVRLELPDLTLTLTTDAGVFSADRIDPGSRVLLLESPRPTPQMGQILDLGCGYGSIALALAARAPDATVWAVDVNERARGLCAENAEANGLTNVRVVAPDELPDDVALDGLWSNPPIRIGKQELHALLERWLARLVPDGRAWLVVQKHLGSDSLATWLERSGWPTRRLASRQGYRVLEVDASA
jgi:16S rRNA (guanine1207-N2)-methyltransferase